MNIGGIIIWHKLRKLFLKSNPRSKISIFESTELIKVGIYEILGPDKAGIYIGQTIQGFDTRYGQHLRDPLKKEWKKLMKGVFEIKAHQLMTPFEAHVCELYEINERGGKRTLKNKKMWNKKNPISESKFKKYKKLHNPCKFY